MNELTSLQDVIEQDLCISCGACASMAPEDAFKMVLDEAKGILVPELNPHYAASMTGLAFDVCPGKGVPLVRMAEERFGQTRYQCYELGSYRYYAAVHATDSKILEHASSGGIITAIAAYLLETEQVQGVTASRFIYGAPGPRTVSFIARSVEELISAQGSKYCPTSTNNLMRQCQQEGGAYLFSGTPCQVEALRLAQRIDPDLEKIFPYTVANFCAGYRDYRHLDGIVRYDQMNPAEVTYFRFRGGGQPGSMKAVDRSGRTITAAYPQYDGRTQIAKHKRCVYCIDATGELADFSCGDAWLDRLLETGKPWSIVMARSTKAEEVVREMIEQGKLEVREVTEDEICYSQRQNLASKKFRQRKRMTLSRLFGIVMPSWDVELVNQGTYFGELRTLFGKTRMGLKWREFKKRLKKT